MSLGLTAAIARDGLRFSLVSVKTFVLKLSSYYEYFRIVSSLNSFFDNIF